MPSSRLWLFDLDDTLHNASAGVFPLINQQMTDYIAQHLQLERAAANQVREAYWRRYGATLTGMIRQHGTDPKHFLHHTHPLPELLAQVRHAPGLPALLARLPGDKVVFSNGPSRYVRAVCRHLGILPLLRDCFGVDRLSFHPKPDPRAYRRVLAAMGRRPEQCVLVEDSLVNLLTARRLGMRTVWLAPAGAVGKPAYVDVRLRQIGELARHVRLAKM